MTVPTEVKSEEKVAQVVAPEQSETKEPAREEANDVNWRQFRQQRAKEREEKIEAEKRLADKEREALALKAAMESLLSRSGSTNSHQGDQEVEESEDQRIQKKVDRALEEREKKYQVERAKTEAAELPQKLSSTFSDFNKVCSQENLDYLEYHYPEIWSGFKHSQGNFDVWAGLYKTIKRLVPTTDTRKELAKIEKNLSKPQSMSSPGVAQTGDNAPTELTEQRRKDNWDRMKKAMRSV